MSDTVTPDNRHQHLIVRAEVLKPPFDGKVVDRWLADLIQQIDMKIMFGPRSMYCDVKGNRGMTSFAIIETSHTVFHSWDECYPAVVQFDVYTCSCLDINIVFQALDIFEPTKIQYKFIDREDELITLDESFVGALRHS